MRKLFTYVLFISLTGLISCKKSNSGPAKTNANKIAPDGFNFATSRNISLNLYLQSPKGEALAGVVVNVYRPSTTAPGTAIFTAVTDKNGNISAKISVPTYLSTLIIDPSYVGLLHNATAAINGTSITAIIGGPNVYSGDIVPVPTINSTSSTSSLAVFSVTNGSTTFNYPSPYTSTSDACVNTTAIP